MLETGAALIMESKRDVVPIEFESNDAEVVTAVAAEANLVLFVLVVTNIVNEAN
jgi:hypothetical protein